MPQQEAAPTIADLHKQIIDAERQLATDRTQIAHYERAAAQQLERLNQLQKKFDEAVEAARSTAIADSEWGMIGRRVATP